MSIFGVILICIFPHSDWIRRDTPYLSIFKPDARKYGSEYLRIRTLFTQWRMKIFKRCFWYSADDLSLWLVLTLKVAFILQVCLVKECWILVNAWVTKQIQPRHQPYATRSTRQLQREGVKLFTVSNTLPISINLTFVM